jgi:hypothetical protein
MRPYFQNLLVVSLHFVAQKSQTTNQSFHFISGGGCGRTSVVLTLSVRGSWLSGDKSGQQRQRRSTFAEDMRPGNARRRARLGYLGGYSVTSRASSPDISLLSNARTCQPRALTYRHLPPTNHKICATEVFIPASTNDSANWPATQRQAICSR